MIEEQPLSFDDNEELRTCLICREAKPLNGFYSSNKWNDEGYTNTCIVCLRESITEGTVIDTITKARQMGYTINKLTYEAWDRENKYLGEFKDLGGLFISLQ